MTTPKAEVIKHRDKFVHIACPYCGEPHEHKSGGERFKPGKEYHRAPGCGMFRPQADRLAGYTFTIPNR